MPYGNTTPRLHSLPEKKEVRRTLREQQTPAERVRWQRLRNGQLGGHKFKRQFGIGPYILDFYCAVGQLAIEIDGAVHDDVMRRVYDDRRNVYLQEHGIVVLRFTNNQVMHQLGIALQAIEWQLSTSEK